MVKLFQAEDTTWVKVHDATDMTWYGHYKQWGEFPDGSVIFTVK